jgi:hypothetical protein
VPEPEKDAAPEDDPAFVPAEDDPPLEKRGEPAADPEEDDPSPKLEPAL